MALAGSSLGGCFVQLPGPSLGDIMETRGAEDYGFPADDTTAWTNNPATEKERMLARSDFSVELVRFTDSRRARSMELETPDKRIYEYDPDVLLQGVKFQVPAIIENYLCYRPRKAKHYKVEIDLRRLNTMIKSGTLLSGSWGRYSVDMDVDVLVRRPDSSVVLKRSYHLSETQPRTDVNGRGPSKEMDRTRMYDLSESMLRKVAEDIGWDIRQFDSRSWQIKPVNPLPDDGLNRAKGSPDALPKIEMDMKS